MRPNHFRGPECDQITMGSKGKRPNYFPELKRDQIYKSHLNQNKTKLKYKKRNGIDRQTD